MLNICEMNGVRRYDSDTEGVELWLNEATGRLVLCAIHDGVCRVEIDLWDIVGWLQTGINDGPLESSGTYLKRHKPRD